MTNQDCVFCKIAAKQLPASIVYEDSKVVAFLDIAPVNPGHTLVIPKGHYSTLNEIPDSTLAELVKAIKKVSKAVLKATKYKEFNIEQSNGSIAGQVVMHAHFHIVPRYKGDGLTLGKRTREDHTYTEGEVKELTKAIRQAMTE
mgnify:CR=1 FL=1